MSEASETNRENLKASGSGTIEEKEKTKLESCEDDTTREAWRNPLQRRLVSLKTEENVKRGPKFTVMTYNVLADKWASSDKHKACPNDALKWEYRREKLVSEIISYNADIICLQEVQQEHYVDFNNALTRQGYEGFYLPKLYGDAAHRDGCATFFLSEKFSCMRRFDIMYGSHEFCDSLPSKLSGTLERYGLLSVKLFNTRGNVALIVLLSFESNVVCIANTHLVARGDIPEVKMWQTYCLLQKLQEIVGSLGNDDVAIVICGDFNSRPPSAAYSFLVHNEIDPEHKELEVGYGLKFDANKLRRSSIDLSSAYSAYFEQGVSDDSSFNDDNVMKRWMNSETKEPMFTHYAFDFKETLDYIFYTHNNLEVEKLLEVVDWDIVTRAEDRFIPSRVWPSDHILLLAQFSCIGDRENTKKRKRQTSDDSPDLETDTKSLKTESKGKEQEIDHGTGWEPSPSVQDTTAYDGWGPSLNMPNDQDTKDDGWGSINTLEPTSVWGQLDSQDDASDSIDVEGKMDDQDDTSNSTDEQENSDEQDFPPSTLLPH